MKYVKENWTIIIFIGTVIAVCAVAMFRLNLTEGRVEALENKFEQYPTEKWFELKFETIEKRFSDLEKILK